MPKVYRLQLTEEQKQELTKARNSHPKPFVRERAAAILKVDSGWSLRKTAYEGLLRRHTPETVKEWCERYLLEGLDGLKIRSGRGRKAAFSPYEPRRSPTRG